MVVMQIRVDADFILLIVRLNIQLPITGQFTQYTKFLSLW